MFWIHSTTRYTFSVVGNFGNNLDRGFKIVMRVPYKFCRGPQGWGGRGMWDMVQGALGLLDLLPLLPLIPFYLFDILGVP